MRVLGVNGHGRDRAELVLTAIGAYQLGVVLRASERLAAREIAHAVSPAVVDALYPTQAQARVFVTHTRPEPMLGVLAPLGTGPARTAGLGYSAAGGTLDVEALLFVNGSSWAHVLAAATSVLGLPREAALSADEIAALDRRRSPEGVIT